MEGYNGTILEANYGPQFLKLLLGLIIILISVLLPSQLLPKEHGPRLAVNSVLVRNVAEVQLMELREKVHDVVPVELLLLVNALLDGIAVEG